MFYIWTLTKGGGTIDPKLLSKSDSSQANEHYTDTNAPRLNGGDKLRVHNPNNQSCTYNPDGNNQPLIGNIGLSLQHQRDIHGIVKLKGEYFTQEQVQYIADYLKHNNSKKYANISEHMTKVTHNKHGQLLSNNYRFSRLQNTPVISEALKNAR